MNEKNILCFGDSNTWGCNPADSSRYDRNTRWPCILQQELGEGFHVVEEGLCGRNTVWDDPVEGDRNGLKQIVPILKSHEPLDLVIILLGTNDLKMRFNVPACDVAEGVWQLVKAARSCEYPRTGKAPEVLVVCPPPFAPLEPTPFRDMFAGGEEKSHQLAAAFEEVAARRGFKLFKAGDVIQSSTIDGIHLEAPEHGKLARALAETVRGIAA